TTLFLSHAPPLHPLLLFPYATPPTSPYTLSLTTLFRSLSMTLSLAAVFVPVLFLGGMLGRLLHEFAVTIAAAVLEIRGAAAPTRSEEHTSELQSRSDLVCRLLLEKKKVELTYA